MICNLCHRDHPLQTLGIPWGDCETATLKTCPMVPPGYPMAIVPRPQDALTENPDTVKAVAATIRDLELAPIDAEDVRAAKFDTDALGRVFPETRLAVALQVIRSIAREGYPSIEDVQRLCAATLERIG